MANDTKMTYGEFGRWFNKEWIKTTEKLKKYDLSGIKLVADDKEETNSVQECP